jgi:hypothetical protein
MMDARTTPREHRHSTLGSEDERVRLILFGIVLSLTVFLFWLRFSFEEVTFYRCDNVIEFAPLIIDGARQISEGVIPFRTNYLGGAGGIPLVVSTYPGILNPFTFIPGLFLNHNPEIMINVIAALHLALFALGGYALAVGMNAPLWVCLVAGISLGFSGCFAVYVSVWLSVFLPFTFIPWLLLGLLKIYDAESKRSLFLAHIMTSVSLFLLFYSGSPNAAFYGGLVAGIFLASLLIESGRPLTSFVVRLIPQALFFVAVIGPLLVGGAKYLAQHSHRGTRFFRSSHRLLRSFHPFNLIGMEAVLYLPCSSVYQPFDVLWYRPGVGRHADPV